MTTYEAALITLVLDPDAWLLTPLSDLEWPVLHVMPNFGVTAPVSSIVVG